MAKCGPTYEPRPTSRPATPPATEVVGLREESSLRERFSPERENTETKARSDQTGINARVTRDARTHKAAQLADAAEATRAKNQSQQRPYRFQGPTPAAV